ncbi:MAG: hypothetical protein IJR61_01365 [Clostridia bacterium]|nr:hypothetical protein [Clostridia bacterium]
MNKLLKKVALICVLALVCVFFASCESVDASRKSVTVTVIAGEFEKTYEAEGEFGYLADVLNFLQNENAEEGSVEEKKHDFTYSGTISIYGIMIKEVCGNTAVDNDPVVSDSGTTYSGSSWFIYTGSPREINGVANHFEEFTYEYAEKTYYSCAKGASGQVVENGEHFLLVLSAYEYTY